MKNAVLQQTKLEFSPNSREFTRLSILIVIHLFYSILSYIIAIIKFLKVEHKLNSTNPIEISPTSNFQKSTISSLESVIRLAQTDGINEHVTVLGRKAVIAIFEAIRLRPSELKRVVFAENPEEYDQLNDEQRKALEEKKDITYLALLQIGIGSKDFTDKLRVKPKQATPEDYWRFLKYLITIKKLSENTSESTTPDKKN
jgi:hypothetical protein